MPPACLQHQAASRRRRAWLGRAKLTYSPARMPTKCSISNQFAWKCIINHQRQRRPENEEKLVAEESILFIDIAPQCLRCTIVLWTRHFVIVSSWDSEWSHTHCPTPSLLHRPHPWTQYAPRRTRWPFGGTERWALRRAPGRLRRNPSTASKRSAYRTSCRLLRSATVRVQDQIHFVASPEEQ